MIQVICKGCGQAMMATDENGKLVCLTCMGIDENNSIPVEVKVPDTLKCYVCKKRWKVEDILKQWIDIPFYDSKHQSFYDGCRGWD